MAAHNELGRNGEDLACQHLTSLGYEIVARNWRYDRHEIDVIAENSEYIVFVEVKTRATTQWGNPEDFISERQIKRIVAAADFYIREYDVDKEPRFDVVSIISDDGKTELEHIEDAFIPPIN